jgi:hypothetical protein
MIRRSAIVTLMIAIALGFGLYRLTYEVQTLEGELVRVNRQIASEHEAIGVLQAEWSYLNEPSRLEALTKKHLSLSATQDSRIRSYAELPMRQGDVATAVAANTAPPAAQSAWGDSRPTLASGKPLP